MAQPTMTTTEVAHVLSRTTDWGRRRCRDGAFASVKTGPHDGSRLLVYEASVQAWLEQRTIRHVQRKVRRVETTVQERLEQIRRERIGRERRAS